MKCIKNTPAYFAERLHKAMAVRLFLIITFSFPLVTNQSFPAPIICDVFAGRGDQGQNPDPYHGNPLWGWHVGHQTGVCKEVRKVSVHSHLGKSSHIIMTVTLMRLISIFIWYYMVLLCFSGWHLWGLQEATAEAMWGQWLKRKEESLP